MTQLEQNTSAVATAPSAAAPGRLRAVSRWMPDELGVLIALAAIVAVIAIPNPAFVDPGNVGRLVAQTTFVGLLALGTVFLLAVGEIDLSVGWNFNFSAVITVEAMTQGIHPWIAALLGVLFGTGLGVVNGIMTVGLRMPAIIVTLGTFSMFLGLSLVVNKAQPMYPRDEQLDSSFFSVLSKSFASRTIPVIAIVFLVIVVVLQLVLQRSRFGYRVQAIGSNPEAARLTGLPISLTKVQALALMGMLAGLSGVLFVGFRASIDPQTGGDFVFPVIAAAIIGGTPLSGGYGTVVGALIGALIITSIRSGIIFFGITAGGWDQFATGLVIVLAVAIDLLVRARRARESAG